MEICAPEAAGPHKVLEETEEVSMPLLHAVRPLPQAELPHSGVHEPRSHAHLATACGRIKVEGKGFDSVSARAWCHVTNKAKWCMIMGLTAFPFSVK